MSNFVFDASAILAIYYSEAGIDRVKELLDAGSPFISAANLCEVLTKLSDDGFTVESVLQTFYGLQIDVREFGTDLAIEAAKLRSNTRSLGLSLGDLACLALGIKLDATIVTADKSWAKLKSAKIEVIR